VNASNLLLALLLLNSDMITKITCSDGSHTLFNDEINDTYHSRLGAIQESEHVYIKNGLLAIEIPESKTINILEVGFGTGLNALLTALASGKEPFLDCQINYHTFETHPISIEMSREINYPSLLGVDADVIFNSIHECSWDSTHRISNNFSFSKWHLPVQEIGSISAPLPLFNLVFYDAFAPRNQPEMWEESIFNLIFNHLESKALLVTYCAKAIVKRTLLASGFDVRKAKGPMRKREIILAGKP